VLAKVQSDEQAVNFLRPLYILERFATVFRERSEVNKTQLQLLTKLRWDSFNNYLHWLIDRGFVKHRKEGKGEIYYLTERGRESLNILTTFIGCLN
jgi:predicted transcriptional regulator